MDDSSEIAERFSIKISTQENEIKWNRAAQNPYGHALCSSNNFNVHGPRRKRRFDSDGILCNGRNAGGKAPHGDGADGAPGLYLIQAASRLEG